MGRDVSLKPVGALPDLEFLESLRKKFERAQAKNLPDLDRYRNCWLQNFENAIQKCRTAKNDQNIVALKMLQTITPPTRKLEKKLSRTIDQLVKNRASQRRKDRLKAETDAVADTAAGSPRTLGEPIAV